MGAYESSATPGGLLAAHLAKLQQQLRHLLAGGGHGPELMAAGDAFSLLNRLRTGAVLLQAPGAPAGPEAADVGRSLAGVVAVCDGDVPRVPRHLAAALARLAVRIESLAAATAPDDTARGWAGVLAALQNAGTVLEVCDEVQASLDGWAARYADQDLTDSQEAALRSRWQEIRSYGDSLFAADDAVRLAAGGAAVAGAVLAGCRVLVLVDSPLLADRVVESLTAAGGEVVRAATPDRLLAGLGAETSPELLICDNVEPTRHLQAVRARLALLGPADRPPLVLATSAADAGGRLAERARQLGARGTWAAPWAVTDLLPLLPR